MTNNSSDSEPESCETGVQLHHIHDGDEMKNNARLSLSMQEKELPSTADGESQDEKSAEQSEVQIENRNEMRGTPLGLVIASLLSAVFCVALDNTSMIHITPLLTTPVTRLTLYAVLATAIPKITDAFHTIDDVGWYGASYFLTTCSKFKQASVLHPGI
jgi:hypothetical protein